MVGRSTESTTRNLTSDFAWNETQSKLLLNRGKKRWAQFNVPAQIDIVVAGESCFIGHRSARRAGEKNNKIVQAVAPSIDLPERCRVFRCPARNALLIRDDDQAAPFIVFGLLEFRPFIRQHKIVAGNFLRLVMELEFPQRGLVGK